MKSSAATIEAYLASLPEDRRNALSAVRQVVVKNLPEGYVETMAYGMIAYAIPLAIFPNTYNGHPLMIAALGSQKNYLVIHLMGIYGDPKLRTWFEDEFRKAGKKLDAGKGCVRFKTLDDLPLGVIGEVIAKVPTEKLMKWHDMAQAQRPHKRPRKKPAAKATNGPRKSQK